jgi:hypothetical protein
MLMNGWTDEQILLSLRTLSSKCSEEILKPESQFNITDKLATWQHLYTQEFISTTGDVKTFVVQCVCVCRA